MSTNRKRLFSNFFSLGIIQGTNYLLPILIMPYVIKRIGADGFGIVAIAQVVMMFFTTIADYGFNLTATRDVSLNRNNTDVISGIFCTVLLTKFLICLLLFIILVLFLILVPGLHAYAPLYLLAYTSVIGQSLLMNWLFQGIEKMNIVLYISLIGRLAFAILVLIFIRHKADYIYFIFFTGVGNILAGAASIIFAIRYLRLKMVWPSWQNIVTELKSGWHITTSSLAVSSYLYINILVLRFYWTDTVVGYYSIAEKIIMAGRQILTVYFQAIYPQVCQLVQAGRRELFAFFRKFYLPFLGLVLAGCIVLFVFPRPIIGIFLENNREISAQYLRIMSFVPFIICLNIPAYQVLIAHDQKIALFKVFVSGTLINLFLNIFIVKTWGPVGTSWIIFITELLVTIGLVLMMVVNPKVGILKYLRTRFGM